MWLPFSRSRFSLLINECLLLSSHQLFENFLARVFVSANHGQMLHRDVLSFNLSQRSPCKLCETFCVAKEYYSYHHKRTCPSRTVPPAGFLIKKCVPIPDKRTPCTPSDKTKKLYPPPHIRTPYSMGKKSQIGL